MVDVADKLHHHPPVLNSQGEMLYVCKSNIY